MRAFSLQAPLNNCFCLLAQGLICRHSLRILTTLRGSAVILQLGFRKVTGPKNHINNKVQSKALTYTMDPGVLPQSLVLFAEAIRTVKAMNLGETSEDIYIVLNEGQEKG